MQIDIDFYKKNGYLLLRDFFSKEAINNILLDAKGIFLRQFVQKEYTNLSLSELSEEAFNKCLYRLFEDDFIALSNCGKQAQHLISLHTLSLQNNIIELLHSVGLSSPVISTRPVMFFNHPKLAKQKVYYKVDAHQDWRSMQGSLNSVVVWVPLTNISKALGALEILPGSHLKGLMTDHIDTGFGMVSLNDNELSRVVSVEVNAGDALLFSSFLVHQSGENISESPRWSCHFRYNDLDEKTFIERKYAHPYIYKPSDELITPNFPGVEDVRKVFHA